MPADRFDGVVRRARPFVRGHEVTVKRSCFETTDPEQAHAFMTATYGVDVRVRGLWPGASLRADQMLILSRPGVSVVLTRSPSNRKAASR